MRGRFIRIALLAGTATLLCAAPALADATFIVTGTGDATNGSCAASAFGGSSCTTLRAAVNAANAADGSDVISLQEPGTYTLTQPAALRFTGDAVIVGLNAHATTIAGNGRSRVAEVIAPATLALFSLTVSGGVATGDIGGNLYNTGSLLLTDSRVTGGSATAGGGGIANVGGNVALSSSLVDHNSSGGQAGGILNQDAGTLSAVLELVSSTVAFNTAATSGGGIVTDGNVGANQTTLIQSTVARNTASVGVGGIDLTSGGTASATGSIIAGNVGAGQPGSNCGAGLNDGGFNLEDGSACAFSTGTADPQLGPALTDNGGGTDVLAIAATSPAKGLVNPCQIPTDQRSAPRQTAACDAGAFEQGATAPPLAPIPTPTPTYGKTVVVSVVSGTVLIKKPGSNEYTELDAAEGIPVGSSVDTRDGHVKLASGPKSGGTDSAVWWDGIFKVTQSSSVTQLQLVEPLACRTAKRATTAGTAKKPKTRRLWGDGKGKFSTKGQFSSATVRGTKWLVEDQCGATVTRVKRGVVTVRDFAKRTTVSVRAGHSYTARARR